MERNSNDLEGQYDVEATHASEDPTSTTVFTKTVFTKREKNFLMAIKSLYAFAWGFLNGVTVLISSRFATMMTGNLLLLAIETREWMVEEMLFTTSLIAAYVVAGAIYDALNIVVKDQNKVLAIAMGGVLTMGVLADVLRFMLNSCSGDNFSENCNGKYLYFLTPIAFLTGIVANGYCIAHSDGVISTLMTGHMRICPNSLIKLYLPREGNRPQGPDRILLLEKARLSVAMITMFFLGVLAGDVSEDLVRSRNSRDQFSPVFIMFSIFLVTLCTCHSKLCERFFQYQEDKT